MKQALLLIDIQNDYFPSGTMELEGTLEAGANGGKLLAAAREKGLPVFHIQHLAARPDATFFLPGTHGAKIHECVAPTPGEAVIAKHYPNSFRQTDLRESLQNVNVESLIIAGMMSHMCVDATTRAAFDLGYSCLLAHDACATRALEWNGTAISAQEVHGSFMAALGAVYAQVSSTAEIIAEGFST